MTKIKPHYKIETEFTVIFIPDKRQHNGDTYAIVAITLADFYSHAKIRAKKWKAIYVDKNNFKKMAKPLSFFIPEFKKNW